ncbi:Monogalactosyldiacylglycerol synthase [Caldicellulosiruptor saccharolyticus DSM 8903]|uniref:Monogalactosyldiacylglycerol synthase n=1 Tax=Caldicellulosiruptor saccharolyticus (strain ATCC 43494 / DSM 8903 / Tp8T 6331) TaxID=351627 RepID=A4XLY0_CALS8|nr:MULTISPECIES: glycosyltransferase [Caldicellulosiruptor]ABP67915.1 Monogalactosyldiacylglycerol synthase [Caldicellulosiruptor saccharolyticus DSM 8903]
MNILILSLDAGGGHFAASNALKTAFLQKDPQAKVEIVDTLKIISPILDKLAVGTYLKAIKTVPFIYGLVYDSTDKDPPTRFSKAIYEKFYFAFYKLYNIISELNPDVIIGTHPSPIDMVSQLKKRGNINVPIISIVTDFTIHPYWINEYADYIIVHHENLVYEAVKKGAPGKKVIPLGIPINPSFSINYEKKEILSELNLEDKPTILIMGGSLGLGNIEDIVEMVCHICDESYQIIVVTGKNKTLKKSLEERNFGRKVVVFGFISFIDKLMAISDILITKPGGLTCAEALSCKLPMILISPIPGQEERNTFYLINNGAAAYVKNIESFDIVFNQIINNPQRLEHMKLACSFLAKPSSSNDIVEFIKGMVL